MTVLKKYSENKLTVLYFKICKGLTSNLLRMVTGNSLIHNRINI